LISPFKAVGIGLADAIGFTIQALFLLLVFKIRLTKKSAMEMDPSGAVSKRESKKEILNTVLRTVSGSIVGGMVIVLIIRFSTGVLPELLVGIMAAILGIAAALPFILKDPCSAALVKI
jgi:hypothetical protein